jgi:hypothetical protein
LISPILFAKSGKAPKDLLFGNGQLYVFGAVDNSTINTWDDVYYNKSGAAVNGTFIPLTWNYQTQNETDLDNEAIAADEFQFIRPEDGSMDKRPDMQNILYMAETGGETDENNEIIPPGLNDQNWTNGRIYQFEFTDPTDPTKVSFRVLFDGNDPMAPGYNVLDASKYFGDGSWLVDVQAHTIDEGGQLLLLKIPGS